MKLKNLISCFFLGAIVTSCIKNEAPNSEADILACTIDGDILNREPIIGNDEITLFVKDGASLTKVSPKFTLTDGASINPPNGSECDFTKSQSYTYIVTSQDTKWTKEYVLKVLPPINTNYNFENVKLDRNNKYYIFTEKFINGNEIFSWASGNEGFAFTGVVATKDQYPTTQDNNGHDGKCLKLQTKSTGKLGASVGMPLAAGNLFLGSFKVNLADVLSATKFGVPFTHIPTKMEGWYKYQPGPIFYKLNDKKELIEDPSRTDQCDIYAVFYEVTTGQEVLTGHNILDENNHNIISIARINQANIQANKDWAPFNLEFKMLPGRTVEESKLIEGKYNLAVVFSSSIDGAYFEGAPESTLWIDEVSIGYAGKNELQ